MEKAIVAKASPEFMANMAKAGRLANGLNARNAPQSAAAAAKSQKDFAAAQKNGGKVPAPKAPAKERAKKVVAEAKARTEAKKAVRKDLKVGADRPYKVLVPVAKLEAREGTWRLAMLTAICGNTSTDAAKAAIKKNREFADRKLDFSWSAAQGYIKF